MGALSDHQERDGEVNPDDCTERVKEARRIAREKRLAEGGRGGGDNDRQENLEKDKVITPEVDPETNLDEFGRRRYSKGAAEGSITKEARAKAALERLRQKGVAKDKASDGATSNVGRSDRSRSRDGRDQRHRR